MTAAVGVAAGAAVGVSAYPAGEPGLQKSIETVASYARECRYDPEMVGWVADVYTSSGLDGRDRPGAITRAAALLGALRAKTIYKPDPKGTEWIQKPHVTLCLRGHCIPAGDCFIAGTLLLREDFAFVKIEDLQPGDRIWGYDRWTRVEAVVFKGKQIVDAVEMNNGSTMYLTPGHKVYVGRCKHGKKVSFDRIAVSDLVKGDTLLQPKPLQIMVEKTLAVREIERAVRKAPVWDIQTEDHYVYLPEHDVTVSNCDDLQASLCGAFLAAGLDAYIVRQSFGANQQPHVLVGLVDEGGQKWYCDPSTREPVYQGSKALREEWIDPMKQPSKRTGTTGAELATFGAPPTRDLRRLRTGWIERRYGRTWVGVGGAWSEAPSPLPVGFGEIAGLHTTHEASDLLRALGFEVSRMSENLAQNGDTWKNADLPGYLAWLSDYGTAMVAWTSASGDAQKAITIVPTAVWDAVPAEGVFQSLLTAFHPFGELDRRWRAAGKAPPPNYTGIPQPTAPDFDLKVYVLSDKVLETVKKAATFGEAAAPWVIGIVVLAGGVYIAKEVGVFDAIRAAARRARSA